MTHPRYTCGRAAQVFAPLHWAPRNTSPGAPPHHTLGMPHQWWGEQTTATFMQHLFFFLSSCSLLTTEENETSLPTIPVFVNQNLSFVLSPAKTCQVKETHSFSCLWLTASFPACDKLIPDTHAWYPARPLCLERESLEEAQLACRGKQVSG